MRFDRVRHEIVATCLQLADRGYLAGTGGNVACRVDEEHFAVTPSAIDYYAMSAEDICVLRLGDLVCVEGARMPSVEHRLHAHVLRIRRDCHASIHTHQPVASAYTLLGRALEIRDPRLQGLLGARAALVGYAPSGTQWLAAKLRNALRREIDAYLMRNHGIVCCGATLGETVAKVEALEEASIAFFRQAIGSRSASESDPALLEIVQLLNPSGFTEIAQ